MHELFLSSDGFFHRELVLEVMILPWEFITEWQEILLQRAIADYLTFICYVLFKNKFFNYFANNWGLDTHFLSATETARKVKKMIFKVKTLGYTVNDEKRRKKSNILNSPALFLHPISI